MKRMRRIASILLSATILLATLPASFALAEDWPTWRHDSGRSGATSERLAEKLYPRWTLRLPKLHPAWAEDRRLHFDASYEPIVVGQQVFLSSSANDSVSAYDLKSGERKWRFFASGPVRFAPVHHDGRLYFGADDGAFHCLDAKTGKLHWRFQAAPGGRRVIGNARLTSVWPMRGGPVITGERIHFSVGVWPFEGTLLYSLDLATGELKSKSDAAPTFTSSSLSNEAPQGYLAAAGDHLFVPCGRANVLAVNPANGKRLRLRYSAKGQTDYHVVAVDRWMFHGSKIIDFEKNAVAPTNARRPIVADGVAYYAAGMRAHAIDLANPTVVEKKDRRGKVVRSSAPKPLWSFNTHPADQVLAKAGSQLIAAASKELLVLSLTDKSPTLSWKHDLGARPLSVVAANEHLLVATADGAIHCFGPEPLQTRLVVEPKPAEADIVDSSRARQTLDAGGSKTGYAVVFGWESPDFIETLIRSSDLHVVAVDPEADKVGRLRNRLDAVGLYGSRCTALVGSWPTANLPPYLANLVVVSANEAQSLRSSDQLKAVAKLVRPYGGSLCIESKPQYHEQLAKQLVGENLQQFTARRVNSYSILKREGALPKSANWTHEFGDPGNTLMSKEQRVMAPLGVLWFGGPAADGSMFFDRHEWGPSMAVIQGRMFIQGPFKFTAVDVYTGRILWQNQIKGGKSPGRGSNWGPSGYHFVAAEDAIYFTFPNGCQVLDPATGELVREMKLEDEKDYWGRIRIVGDRIFAPVFRHRDGTFAPEKLVVLHRKTGEVLWTQKTDMSFPLMAIGNGKVFCYEGMLEGLYIGNSKVRVRGAPKAGPILNVKAFDIETGDEIWNRSTPRAASWLAYSADDDVLLVSNKQGIDAIRGKDGEELWTKVSEGKGFRGHPENYWDKVIIWKGRILDQRGPGRSYDIRTGEAEMVTNPITDQATPWEFTKIGHHCNYAIASEHLMTFRAASAGFLDLTTGGTSRLEGFRSGCRNSLIPANGVLNAPNFAHGCSCSYSIFTSLALVHVPESDLWSYGAEQTLEGRVKRLGVNFAAPGDRRAGDRTLWVNYPNVGGPSPKLNIQVQSKDAAPFRLHSAQLKGESKRWVSASGMRGVTRVKIPLLAGDQGDATAHKYTVRLHFAEPSEAAAGANVFDVSLQGQRVLEAFDVVDAAGGPRRTVVREFDGVEAETELTIDFSASAGRSLINGIEVHLDE